MALFQKTVEQKYLKQLNADLIHAKYLEFKAHFGNTEIQENIRNSKEEQYQGEFLIDLFVKILGYVKILRQTLTSLPSTKTLKTVKKPMEPLSLTTALKRLLS